MKVVGILRVKDEADLLPAVLDNATPGVEEIFAYDDNSSDGTLQILKDHPAVTYIEPYDPDFSFEMQKTRALEKAVRRNNPWKEEEIWVSLLAGDLFWLNMLPQEAAERALSAGFDCSNGTAVDFGRWSWDEETDTWPNWHKDPRQLCKWCGIIEQLPVVWKIADYTFWERLPWARGFHARKLGVAMDMPFLEHQGKRSPRYHQWKYASASRDLPRIDGVRTTRDQWTYEFAYEHGKKLGFWENHKRIPWLGPETLETLVKVHNMERKSERNAFWRTYDDQRHDDWPERTDV